MTPTHTGEPVILIHLSVDPERRISACLGEPYLYPDHDVFTDIPRVPCPRCYAP